MALCNLLCSLVILLLIIAGIAFLLGADRLGQAAIDMIRIIILVVLILILIGLVLYLLGHVSIPSIPRVTSIHKFLLSDGYKNLLTPFVF